MGYSPLAGQLGRSRLVSPGDSRLSTAVPLRYVAKVTLFTIHNIMDGTERLVESS